MNHPYKLIWWLLCVLGALAMKLQAKFLRALG